MIDLLNGKSLDISSEKILQLKALFPEVFVENKIDFKRLKQILGENVNFLDEQFELNWVGKADARSEVQKQTTSTLIPERSDSINFDISENIFIEGENLEALRILQKSYFGKVKAIYIDPPYNTGNDSFIYPDNFNERQRDYKKRAGLADEEGNLENDSIWHKNTRESGRFHSVWLSMMYPRLFLARNLLTDDGVIFVSIDDNELENLKHLMNEIFGEENFMVQIIWKKRSTPPNDKIIGANHDYIMVFAKNQAKCKLNLKERTEEQLNRYKNPDNHPKGEWTSGDLMANVKGGRYVKSLHFGILNPNTLEEHFPSNNGNWRFNKSKIQNLLENNEIFFGDDGKGRPKLKRFFKDVKTGVTYPSIWDFTSLNAEGTAEISELLGNMNIFDTPKPSGLIKELIKLGSDQGDTVLDFFGGSGTTAHAVLELNAETEGNRKFIIIQLAEKVLRNSEALLNGYTNIAEIARKRIQNYIGKLPKDKNGTYGFKAFRIDHSNFNIWQNDISGATAILDQLEFFLKSTKPESRTESMLFELILKTGKSLNSRIELLSADDSNFYHLPDHKICICLTVFNQPVRNHIHKLNVKNVFILNDLFQSDEELSNIKLEFSEQGINLTLI